MSDCKITEISDETKIVLAALLDVFYENLMSLSRYINADSEKAPDESFAKFILFAMEERLKKERSE